MEVISIDGIEYVRAAAIARKYKYTSDYIGQLCRAGKVDAKLVGRTWYVSPDSLNAHKGGRYQKSSQNEKTSNDNNFYKSSRINVEAVPRAETVKTIANVRQRNPQYLRRIEWKPVKYEADRSELLPPLRQAERSVSLPVAVAEAEKLTIEDSSKPISLKAEPLPEVALRGMVKVKSAEDDFSNTDNTDKNIDISPESTDKTTVHIHPMSKDRMTAVKIISTESDEESDVLEDKKGDRAEEEVEDAAYTYDVPVTVSENAPFTPRSVAKEHRLALDLEIKARVSEELPENRTRLGLVVTVTLVLVTFVLGTLLLLLENTIVATAFEQSSSLTFSSLMHLLK